MTSAEVTLFVDRLEHRKVKFDEFRNLTAADWEAIKGLLLDRKQPRLKEYVDAMCRFRGRMRGRPPLRPPTYTEAEIIAELERLD